MSTTFEKARGCLLLNLKVQGFKCFSMQNNRSQVKDMNTQCYPSWKVHHNLNDCIIKIPEFSEDYEYTVLSMLESTP